MTDQERRTPPRFVPTLTEVVEGAPEPVAPATEDEDRMPLPESARRMKPAPPPPVLPQGLAPATPLQREARDAPSQANEAALPQQAVAKPPGQLDADLADAVTRLILRADFQDKLAQAVATVVAQQVHAQLSGQVASLTAQLPELVEASVQQAIAQALRKA